MCIAHKFRIKPMFVTSISQCMSSVRKGLIVHFGWEKNLLSSKTTYDWLFLRHLVALSCFLVPNLHNTVEVEWIQDCWGQHIFLIDTEGAEIYCIKCFLSWRDVEWQWHGVRSTGLQLLPLAVLCSTESPALLLWVWASGSTATWATGRRNVLT